LSIKARAAGLDLQCEKGRTKRIGFPPYPEIVLIRRTKTWKENGDCEGAVDALVFVRGLGGDLLYCRQGKVRQNFKRNNRKKKNRY